MIRARGSGTAAAETLPCRICRQGVAHSREVPSDLCYLQCERCRGTFAALESLPSRELEQAQYDLHENDPGDQHYRRFVAHLVEPLMDRLRSGAEGLDYGCGNGPAGAAMLSEASFMMSYYDPFFAPDETVLDRKYDFVFCCEVVEHFHQPSREFDRLDRLLRPDGILAVMTSMEYSDVDFASWHYRRDPAHVAFYKPDTMMHIGMDREWQTILPSRNVALFKQRS